MRAVLAVAVLGGFYVLVGALGVALVLLDVALFLVSPPWGFALGLPLAAMVLALAKRPRAVARLAVEDVPGVVVAPRDQPGLWGLVHQVAESAGVGPPERVTVLAAGTAGVVRRTRWLGLRTVSRELYIGGPLLCCLGEEQLVVVLEQVLAPQTAAMTGRAVLTRVLARPETRRWVVFRLYAKVFFLLAPPVREPSGDVAKEVARIDAAWRMFVDRHLTAAWDAGYLPTSPFDGFLGFWAEVEEAVESSLNLLVEPLVLLDESVRLTMVGAEEAKTRVDWLTLAHIAGRHAAVLKTARLLDAAGQVMDEPGTLATVLDALDAGRLIELGPVDKAPGSRDAGARARREFVREPVRVELDALVGLALADRGLATWARTWAGTGVLVVRPPHGDGVRELVVAAVAERGTTAGLRKTLADLGVGLDYRPEVH